MTTVAGKRPGRVTFPLRMPPDLDQLIRAEAERDQRSMNAVIVRALQAALDPGQKRRAAS